MISCCYTGTTGFPLLQLVIQPLFEAAAAWNPFKISFLPLGVANHALFVNPKDPEMKEYVNILKKYLDWVILSYLFVMCPAIDKSGYKRGYGGPCRKNKFVYVLDIMS